MSGPREQQQVADATLRIRISSYEEAVDLVILGEPIIIVNVKMQLSDAKTQTPMCFHIRRLLHDESLASSATSLAGWLACLYTTIGVTENYTLLYVFTRRYADGH